jgi:hypothetical protein
MDRLPADLPGQSESRPPLGITGQNARITEPQDHRARQAWGSAGRRAPRGAPRRAAGCAEAPRPGLSRSLRQSGATRPGPRRSAGTRRSSKPTRRTGSRSHTRRRPGRSARPPRARAARQGRTRERAPRAPAWPGARSRPGGPGGAGACCVLHGVDEGGSVCSWLTHYNVVHGERFRRASRFSSRPPPGGDGERGEPARAGRRVCDTSRR